jgi:hypothetical protein
VILSQDICKNNATFVTKLYKIKGKNALRDTRKNINDHAACPKAERRRSICWQEGAFQVREVAKAPSSPQG